MPRPWPGYQGGKAQSRLALACAVPGEAGAKGPAEGLVNALALGLLRGVVRALLPVGGLPPPRGSPQTLGEPQAWETRGASGPTSIRTVASPWGGAPTRQGSLILQDHLNDICLVKPLPTSPL